MDQDRSRSAPVRDKAVEEMLRWSPDELLACYRESGNTDAKWALVLQNADMVQLVAGQMHGIYAGFAQQEDILHDGILVLLDAVDKFDPEKGVRFRTYVAKRIRGMVIDLARRQHWSSRRVRQYAVQIGKTEETLAGTLNRMPTDQELADALGMTLEKYEKTLSEIAASNVISLDMMLNSYGGEMAGWVSSGGGTENSQPEEVCQEKELYDILRQGIEGLRENERLVLSLYYEQELSMKEIAHIMHISGPRVSQIHSHAIQKLRGHMERYMADGMDPERNENDGKGILWPNIRDALPEPSAGCGGQ